MKKLLSIFAATGLVATSGATVVACTDNVASLTFVEGKTVADFFAAVGIEVTDHKLDEDYPDQDTTKTEEGQTIEGTIEGTAVANNIESEYSHYEAFALFTETKDLKPEILNENEGTYHMFMLKGSKGDAKATIFVYKNVVTVPEEGKTLYKVTKLNSLEITL